MANREQDRQKGGAPKRDGGGGGTQGTGAKPGTDAQTGREKPPRDPMRQPEWPRPEQPEHGGEPPRRGGREM